MGAVAGERVFTLSHAYARDALNGIFRSPCRSQNDGKASITVAATAAHAHRRWVRSLFRQHQ